MFLLMVGTEVSAVPTSVTPGNQGKHLSRFNLKTMRVAAPSVSNLFGRKQG